MFQAMELTERLVQLGVGGQGLVWSWSTASGDLVAVKTRRPESDPDRDAYLERRFRHEVQCQTLLAHPNIVPILESDFEVAEPYFVMPLANGSLGQIVDAHPNGIPIAQAADYIAQILSAMSYAHTQRVLHRDLKPSNFLLFGQVVRVADFGLGRAIDDQSSLTIVGRGGGTDGYASPEQMADLHSASYESDVYSLGVVFFELLAGRSNARLRNFDSLPDTYRYLVARALSHSPSERFRDAVDMFREIKTSLESPDGPKTVTEDARQIVEAIAAGDASKLPDLARLLISHPNDVRLYLNVLVECPTRVLDDFASMHSALFDDVLSNLAAFAEQSLTIDVVNRLAFFAIAAYDVPSGAATKMRLIEMLAKLWLRDRGWYLQQRLHDVFRSALSNKVRQNGLRIALARFSAEDRALLEAEVAHASSRR